MSITKRVFLVPLQLCMTFGVLMAESFQLEISREDDGIGLSWYNAASGGIQVIEFSEDFSEWHRVKIYDQQAGERLSGRLHSGNRGFFRLVGHHQDALLDQVSDVWLYDDIEGHEPLRKLHYSLPEWDVFMESQPTQNVDHVWMARTVLGPSSIGEYEIVRYDFAPKAPAKTVILTGGMHGNEGNTPDALLRLFREIDSKQSSNPVLDYLRNQVHFIAIPILNPWGYVQGDRRCRETEPFSVNWVREGDLATITIDEDLFPNTGGRFTAQGYISPVNAGKLVVSILSSSDPISLPPKGYKVETVIDSLSFTVSCPDAGDAEGTADMVVLTDMNRQFDINNWTNYSALSWVDGNGVPFANKGTRPYALREVQYLKDVLDAHPDATAYLDFHTCLLPYVAFYGADDNFDRRPVDVVLDFLSPPPEDVLVEAIRLPSANSYAAQVLGMQSFTSEVGILGADEVLTWWINLLIGYSLLF